MLLSLCHVSEQLGVGHDDPEVEVDGRGDAGLELEVTELDGGHGLQAEEHVLKGHVARDATRHWSRLQKTENES